MSVQVEKLEKNMAKLTVEVSAEDFDKAMDSAYKKNRGKMNIPGFRKGKAPRNMIEKLYGKTVFFEDAANICIPDAYAEAAEESKLDIVSQPEIDIVSIEEGKPFVFTATVAVKPEVTLGQYKGIEVEKVDVTVTDEEAAAELDKVREQNSRLVAVEDRAAETGDTVTVDFEGFVDGVAFEGGKGNDYPLTLGSHSFIDTFEDQLVGTKPGDEKDVNVTFPEDYQAEELKGKPALFKVTVKEIKMKELPELNDDFAQDVSEFDTLDEYVADFRKKLVERKEAAAKSAKEEQAIEKVIENATMDIPDPMVDMQVRQMAEDFAQRIQQQGISMEQYMQYTGMDPKTFLENMKPQAVKRIQARLVLEAIVKAENLTADEEDIKKEIENMASMYKMEVEKLEELIGDKEKEQIALDMCVQKAVDFVVENVVEK